MDIVILTVIVIFQWMIMAAKNFNIAHVHVCTCVAIILHIQLQVVVMHLVKCYCGEP